MGLNPWRYLGLFTQIALTIVFAIAICTLIGLYLDRLFGKSMIFTLVFLFIGIAAGLWTTYQILIKISMDDMDK